MMMCFVCSPFSSFLLFSRYRHGIGSIWTRRKPSGDHNYLFSSRWFNSYMCPSLPRPRTCSLQWNRECMGKASRRSSRRTGTQPTRRTGTQLTRRTGTSFYGGNPKYCLARGGCCTRNLIYMIFDTNPAMITSCVILALAATIRLKDGVVNEGCAIIKSMCITSLILNTSSSCVYRTNVESNSQISAFQSEMHGLLLLGRYIAYIAFM